MSTVLMAGILFGLAGFFALLMKKRFEQQLPLAAGSLIAVLYVFGLSGQLKWGLYAALGCAAAALLAQAVLLIARRAEHPLQYLLTPGTAAFALVAVWLLFSFRGYMFSEWDDFSHWGLAVKNMYLYSALPAGVPQATISYTDYPPASTLFSWLWTVLSGAFNEVDPQRALNMLMLCCLLPAMKDQEWKKPGKAFCTFAVLFVLPLLFGAAAYRTLQVDMLIGCMALYVLYAWFVCGCDAASCAGIAVSLFVLPLVKEMGLAFALLLMVVMAADTLLEAGETRKKHARLLGVFCLATMAGSLSWKGYVHLHQVAEVWNKSRISLSAMVYLLLGQAHPDAYAILRSFAGALCAPDLWHPSQAVSISFVCWLLLAITGSRWMVHSKAEQGRRLKRLYRLLFGGLTGYLAVLLCVYLFLFRTDEALNANSLDRYLASYMLPLIGFTVLFAMNRLGEGLGKPGLHAPLCVLTCMMFVVNPQTVLHQAVLMHEKNVQVYEQRMQELIPADILDQLNPETDHVYYVAVRDSGERYYRAAYQFTPVSIQEGMWSAWPVADKKAEWSDKTAVAYSPDEWMLKLRSDGFTHVYLDLIDERFVKDYACLFESTASICEEQLYRIAETGTGMMLIAVP